jgi:hypothetical protein
MRHKPKKAVLEAPGISWGASVSFTILYYIVE